MSMDVSVESDGEEIVLYFRIDAEGVDAQTFGNALISFDGLYRSINGILNPGLEIEIEFIRSDQGSIRAVLRSLKKDTQNLLTNRAILNALTNLCAPECDFEECSFCRHRASPRFYTAKTHLGH